MKNTFLTLGLFFLTSILRAQVSPQPPETPSVSYHSDTHSKSESSYSVNVDGDEKGGNLSISSSNSDSSYKFRARFNKSKTAIVQKILLDKLGKKNLEINGNTYEWVKKQNDNEVFECKLSKGRLRMYVDKEEVSINFSKEIMALSKELTEVISGRATREHREREVERAQKALERAKVNLERVKSKNQFL